MKEPGNQMALSKTLAKIKELRELMQPGWVFWEVTSMLQQPLSPQHQKCHHQTWFSLTAEDMRRYAGTLLRAPALFKVAVKGAEEGSIKSMCVLHEFLPHPNPERVLGPRVPAELSL